VKKGFNFYVFIYPCTTAHLSSENPGYAHAHISTLNLRRIFWCQCPRPNVLGFHALSDAILQLEMGYGIRPKLYSILDLIIQAQLASVCTLVLPSSCENPLGPPMKTCAMYRFTSALVYNAELNDPTDDNATTEPRPFLQLMPVLSRALSYVLCRRARDACERR